MASQNVDPRLVATSVDSLKTSSDVSTQSSNSQSVKKRLKSELMTLMMSGDKGVSAFPCEENIFNWIGTISGAQGTVYEGLTYKLKLEFPSNYPYKAPNVIFTTPCFHPNVDLEGNICLDILKEKWTALYDVRTVLLSIQSLLSDPCIESPLNPVAANMWENQAEYKAALLKKYERDVRQKSSSS